MIRRPLEDLAVYELDRATDVIRFVDIRELYKNKTSDIVYLNLEGKLFGILCLGDLLHRMKDGIVPVVRDFTRLMDFEDDRARDIFKEKKNIQKIPVINENG